MTINTELPDIDLPEGYVISKKGGRPKKITRDIAVYLARAWRTEIDHKKFLADQWIIEKFNLTDDAAVRNRVKLATKYLRGKGIMVCFPDGGLVIFVPAEQRTEEASLVLDCKENSRGWAWAPGLEQAVEIEANKSFGIEAPLNVEEGNARPKWQFFTR
ncbi:MAG TPA: hypothetical protein VFF81_01760 [Noviherbaspirillum sp.]|nr:hypothetical protein [Noviherbaspirillum sp.]